MHVFNPMMLRMKFGTDYRVQTDEHVRPKKLEQDQPKVNTDTQYLAGVSSFLFQAFEGVEICHVSITAPKTHNSALSLRGTEVGAYWAAKCP